MFARTLVPCLAAMLLLPAPDGAAQQPQQDQRALDTSQLHELDDLFIEHLGISVERLEDMDVVGPDGQEIGEVEEVLLDRDNRVVAVSVEFGGFLGIGDKERVVALEQLALQSGRNKLTLALTQEQIEALPKWDG